MDESRSFIYYPASSVFFNKIRAGINYKFHRIIIAGKIIQRLYQRFLYLAIPAGRA